MRYIAHKKAQKLVDKINSNRNEYFFIHYSCASFIDNPKGSSRITSIAIKSLRTGDASSFSIHLEAERKHMDLNTIEKDYDKLEKSMLLSFYAFLKDHSNNCKYIHWNMRDSNYGFDAINHRAKCLGINERKIITIISENKVNFAVLLKDYFGKDFIAHPQMYNLVKKNNLYSKMFLSGQEEAEAFVKHEFSKLHQSTLKKVECFYQIFNLLCDGNLQTDAKKQDIYGGRIQYYFDSIGSKWYIKLIIWFTPIIIGIIVSIFL